MILHAIDPGPNVSGYVVYDAGKVLRSGVTETASLLAQVRALEVMSMSPPRLAIEMIASYGMAVGETTFDTCRLIGRFQEACGFGDNPTRFRLVYRKDVKMHLCGSMRAKDANIRQALIDRYGGDSAIGKRATPGPLYGVKSHAWAALAVACYAADTWA